MTILAEDFNNAIGFFTPVAFNPSFPFLIELRYTPTPIPKVNPLLPKETQPHCVFINVYLVPTLPTLGTFLFDLAIKPIYDTPKNLQRPSCPAKLETVTTLSSGNGLNNAIYTPKPTLRVCKYDIAWLLVDYQYGVVT